MTLTDEQLKRVRAVFERAGVSFEEYGEEKTREILNGVVDYYTTLAKINLRIKRDKMKEK